jgi:hypothetical protein
MRRGLFRELAVSLDVAVHLLPFVGEMVNRLGRAARVELEHSAWRLEDLPELLGLTRGPEPFRRKRVRESA